MTIEREEQGVVTAVCDGCGDRRILDVEVEAENQEVIDALREIGWRHRRPERRTYPHFLRRGNSIEYPQDFCPDCESDEPAPKPLFGSGRVYHRTVVGAFVNDPCDEWPRALVFEAVGLRRDCGHPIGDRGECSYCRAGRPIGDTRHWTKR